MAPGRTREWIASVAWAGLALVVFAALAPYVPIDPTASHAAALTAYFVGYACVAALVLVVASRAPSIGRGPIGAMLVVSGALAMVLVGVAPSPGVAAAVLMALLAVGTALGGSIGHRIQHAGHLSVVAIVSSVADLASVLSPGGPSHAIAESRELMSLFVLSWPMIGTARIEPLLGVGDVVFVALYLGAAEQHGLSMRRSMIALAIGLAVTACVVALVELPIPALPFLGVAMLVAHREARLPPEHERRHALIAVVVLLAVVGVLVLARGAR